MAAESSSDSTINYNVAVAKRMEVPDEIRLTGPPKQTKPLPVQQLSGVEIQEGLEDVVVPDASTSTKESTADNRRSSEAQERLRLSDQAGYPLNGERREEVMARIETLEHQVQDMKDRLDDFETSAPYLNTRKSVLNTLAFIVWLTLPIGILYLLTPRRR